MLIFGLVGGISDYSVEAWTEYRFLVIDHAVGIYGGLTAATFAVLGIWLGLKLTGPPRETVVVKEVMVPAAEPFVPDESKRDSLGITRREMEILELVAQGMSNREIAGKLYGQREHRQDALQPGVRQVGGRRDGRRRCNWVRNLGCCREFGHANG